MEAKEIIKKQSIHFYLQVRGGIIGFRGNSMFPVLQEGYRIKVEPVDIKKIGIGDIIVFDDTDKLIVHRVIGKIKRGNRLFFLEKGDNSSLIGMRLPASVIGEVKAIIEPSLGIDVNLWRKQNFIFIIWCSTVCSLYTVLSKIKRVILKNGVNSVTKYLYNFYWKVCFSISRPLFYKNYYNE